MASSTQPEEAFIYTIPVNTGSRGIALGFAAFFLFLFLFLPFLFVLFKWGQGHSDPWFWLLWFAMCIPAAAFFLVLAFPPRSWGARIEFRRDSIRSIPKPLLRWIGEPTAEIPIGSEAREILICQGSQEIFDKRYGTGRQMFPLGYRLLIRDSMGHERALKVETADRLAVHQADILSGKIASATGLPVRLIKREADSEGVIRELPWTPDRQAVRLGCLLKLAFAATPLVGGIVVGSLRAEPMIVAAVGIALWLAQTAAVFIFARFSHQKQSGTMKLYWFTTIFTFSASYLMAYAIVFYMFRPR